jgi:3-keto-disaccharide hydrolase
LTNFPIVTSKTFKIALSLFLCLFIFSCQQNEEWIDLFNGENLDGWAPKITGYPLNDNYKNTFRVEDGFLTVNYDGYDSFDEKFGHIFYKEKFSNYLLRIEYRIIGEQVAGGPGWAFKNSGVMVHSQSPESIGLNQNFPISIEVQFLGGNGTDDRPTGNLCTPGTNVDMNGELITQHCITAEAPTYHGEEWVTVDVLVKGNELIAHIIEGDTVIQYTNPAIGGGAVDNYDESVKINGKSLSEGYISLQSESHPIQFRTVKLKKLKD